MIFPKHVTLAIAESAFIELGMVANESRPKVEAALALLGDDPHPPGSSVLQGVGGCYFIALGDYYVVYVEDGGQVTVVGVLHGTYHPLH